MVGLEKSFGRRGGSALRLLAWPYSVALALIMGGALTACEEDDGLRSTETPLLEVSEEELVFPPLLDGESDALTLSLFNRGQGGLILRDFELDPSGSAPGVFEVLLDEGAEPAPLPQELRIAGGSDEPIRLTVRYQPEEGGAIDQAFFRFRSNDRESIVEINLRSSDQGPMIAVTPASVSFPAVDAGQRELAPLLISNFGLSDLVISRFEINGSADFSVLVDGEPATGELDPPLRLTPGENREVTVVYEPPTAGPDEGELVISSNDLVSPNFAVPISANGAAPCIQVLPDLLDFGGGRLVESRDEESPNVLPVTIESCGSSPLRISRIEFEGESFDLATALEPASEDELLILPAAGGAGEAFPSESLEIGFWPLEEQAYGGQLKIYSNASVEPIIVELFGRGTENACPLPAVTQELFQVEPLEVITLDGTPSADPGGSVERWVWTVLERPTGSVSQVVENLSNPIDPAGGGPVDDESTPTASFFVDLAGRYVVELQVYDNLGQRSCAPRTSAQVIIEAIPEKDFHIQLVWSTPDDPDETDNLGTDIDLHFKHENAGMGWGESARTWDCYFENKSPDWGAPGDLLDNPSLDIDDTNGAGPENVNLDRPEVGVSYDVGAIYFRSESTFGLEGVNPRVEHPSYVTVRLFVRGELLAEFVDQELNRGRQLWHVASILWCEDATRCPEFTFHNEIYEEGEYAN